MFLSYGLEASVRGMPTRFLCLVLGWGERKKKRSLIERFEKKEEECVQLMEFGKKQ